MIAAKWYFHLYADATYLDRPATPHAHAWPPKPHRPACAR